MFLCAFSCLIACGIAVAAPNCDRRSSDSNLGQNVIKVETGLGTEVDGMDQLTFNFFGKTNIFITQNQSDQHKPKEESKNVDQPVRVKNKTYFVSTAKTSWMEAHQWCKLANMKLAVIKSAEENERVWSALKKKYPAENNAWIGAALVNPNHGFMWISEINEAASYKNWDANEPNNEGGTEFCVEFFLKNGKWNDKSCNVKLVYICEDEQ